MSLQGLQRSYTFEEKAHGNTPNAGSDVRSTRLPAHQKPSSKSEFSNYHGHEPSRFKRNEDTFEKEDQETGKGEDVSDGHKELFPRFDNDPEAMASPYHHLERDNSVLKRDDKEQMTFLTK
jgi:hypothetical protein